AGMSSGLGCEMRARSSACFTPRFNSASSTCDTTALPSRLSAVTLLMVMFCVMRYPEVVMPLLAKRIKASSVQLMSTWHCGRVDRPITLSTRFCASLRLSMAVSSVRQQYIHLPEARRRTAVAYRVDLLRLALAVEEAAELLPVSRPSNAVARLP